MSGFQLTVPPPRPDDHDDVAWALRAASAQWRRDAVSDAVGWVRRAAETAVEVGCIDRAAELSRLANELSGVRAAVAPPPPAGALSIGSDEVGIDIDMVDADLDDLDGLEELDDLDEVEDLDATEVEEVEEGIEFDDLDDEATPPVAVSPAAPVAPAFVPEARPPTDSVRRRPSTSSGVDLPPSMRPNPSGLDLAEDLEDEEFGELEFDDEPATSKISVTAAPPQAPDLGPMRMDAPSQIPMDQTTAAEYAASFAPRGAQSSPDDIEKELGIDLSIRGVGSPAGRPAEPLAPAPMGFGSTQETPHVPQAAASFGQSIAQDYAPESVQAPLGAYDDPFGSAVSRVPGRASVRPSGPPGAPRITSAEAEPYALAPSAELPSTEPTQYTRPPIEPPSRPLSAPPPDAMAEPDEHPSQLPPVRASRFPGGHLSAPPSAPVLSSAPEPDELDDMFAAISRPPPKPTGEVAASPALVRQEAPSFEAPPPLVAPVVVPQATGATAAADDDEEGILVDGVDLLEIAGFQDLPDDAARELAKSARLVSLGIGEEVSSFGVALITSGSVQLMPTVADAPCASARRGDVLFTKGTFDDGIAVRVVGAEPGSRVAVFSKDALEAATKSSPWVADEFAEVGDKYLAFAGAVLGSLGDSLDDTFRFMVLDKCTVKAKAPGVQIAAAGKALDGMYILGGGTLEILAADGSVQEELQMGDFLFPETVLSAAPASSSVRAGTKGALVLYAPRMAIHELLATCPPFIEMLAG